VDQAKVKHGCQTRYDLWRPSKSLVASQSKALWSEKCRGKRCRSTDLRRSTAGTKQMERPPGRRRVFRYNIAWEWNHRDQITHPWTEEKAPRCSCLRRVHMYITFAYARTTSVNSSYVRWSFAVIGMPTVLPQNSIQGFVESNCHFLWIHIYSNFPLSGPTSGKRLRFLMPTYHLFVLSSCLALRCSWLSGSLGNTVRG